MTTTVNVTESPTATVLEEGWPVMVGDVPPGVLTGFTARVAPALVTDAEPLLTTTEIVPALANWTLFIVKVGLLKLPTGAPLRSHS